MFSVERRSHLLTSLIEAARSDEAVTGAAMIGSTARHETDRWSDIDLALRLAPDADLNQAVDRWSAVVQDLGPVAGHLDIAAGDALYRVFLLADSLQVDLSFWPAGSFGWTGESFEVLFGETDRPPSTESTNAEVLVGWGWLYALHARSALMRGRTWQALQMVDGLRNQVIALMCLRRELPPFEGRGVDQLSPEELAALAAIVASTPDAAPLHAALIAGLKLLQREVNWIDVDLAQRLAPALAELQAECRPAEHRPRCRRTGDRVRGALRLARE